MNALPPILENCCIRRLFADIALPTRPSLLVVEDYNGNISLRKALASLTYCYRCYFKTANAFQESFKLVFISKLKVCRNVSLWNEFMDLIIMATFGSWKFNPRKGEKQLKYWWMMSLSLKLVVLKAWKC